MVRRGALQSAPEPPPPLFHGPRSRCPSPGSESAGKFRRQRAPTRSRYPASRLLIRVAAVRLAHPCHSYPSRSCAACPRAGRARGSRYCAVEVSLLHPVAPICALLRLIATALRRGAHALCFRSGRAGPPKRTAARTNRCVRGHVLRAGSGGHGAAGRGASGHGQRGVGRAGHGMIHPLEPAIRCAGNMVRRPSRYCVLLRPIAPYCVVAVCTANMVSSRPIASCCALLHPVALLQCAQRMWCNGQRHRAMLPDSMPSVQHRGRLVVVLLRPVASCCALLRRTAMA